MTFIPFVKTHFSLQKGFGKPDEIAEKCKDYGYTHCVLADENTLSGVVSFVTACKNHGIIPIIGCEVDGDIWIAKNKEGWLGLVSYVNTGRVPFDPNNGAETQCGMSKIKSSAVKQIYYCHKEDALMHRIMLCSGMKTNMSRVADRINKGEDFDNKIFFIEKSPSFEHDIIVTKITVCF